MDKYRLVKFLNLTSSKNDGEALSALRKANSLLKENNLVWENVIIEPTIPKQEVEEDQAISYMNIKKEQAFSTELKSEINALKKFRNFLLIIMILLFAAVILK